MSFMHDVRAGDKVWLVKEQCAGWLDTDWIPPHPGSCAGAISVNGHIWYVKADGTGFDGLSLIEPLPGEYYEPTRPIADEWKVSVERELSRHDANQEYLQRAIVGLLMRIEDLENRPMHLYEPGVN